MTARALKYRSAPGARLVDPTPPPGAADPALRTPPPPAPNGLPRVRSGEVTSTSEMRTAQSIDDIKREGLTGRQLRIARRVAAKNGIPATSDFDAVLQLRAKGIDPTIADARFAKPLDRDLIVELAENQIKKSR